MGRLPTNNRKYEIEYLWDRHREIIRLTVSGLTPKQVAEKLGITVPVVSYTINSSLAKRYINELRAGRDESAIKLSEDIAVLAPKAVAFMDAVLEGDAMTLGSVPSIANRKDVAFRILDTIGIGPIKQPDVHLHAHTVIDALEEIKRRGRENGMIVSNQESPVEAQFEEVSNNAPA